MIVLDYLGRPNLIPGGLVGRQGSERRVRESQRRQDDEGSRGQREKGRERFEGATPLALKTEEGAVSQGMWAVRKARKGEEVDSLLEPPGERGPADTLTVAKSDAVWTSSLQNCKKINMWGFFKLPTLR